MAPAAFPVLVFTSLHACTTKMPYVRHPSNGSAPDSRDKFRVSWCPKPCLRKEIRVHRAWAESAGVRAQCSHWGRTRAKPNSEVLPGDWKNRGGTSHTQKGPLLRTVPGLVCMCVAQSGVFLTSFVCLYFPLSVAAELRLSISVGFCSLHTGSSRGPGGRLAGFGSARGLEPG